MLADELDAYKERENTYMNNNIWEIQDLYKGEEEKKEKGKIEDKEVILVKPYKVSKLTTLLFSSSFITNKVENLVKYMKFV